MPDLRSSRCKVVYKETAESVIVEREDGTRISLLTKLPDIRNGTEGKLLETNKGFVFVRKPYK